MDTLINIYLKLFPFIHRFYFFSEIALYSAILTFIWAVISRIKIRIRTPQFLKALFIHYIKTFLFIFFAGLIACVVQRNVEPVPQTYARTDFIINVLGFLVVYLIYPLFMIIYPLIPYGAAADAKPPPANNFIELCSSFLNCLIILIVVWNIFTGRVFWPCLGKDYSGIRWFWVYTDKGTLAIAIVAKLIFAFGILYWMNNRVRSRFIVSLVVSVLLAALCIWPCYMMSRSYLEQYCSTYNNCLFTYEFKNMEPLAEWYQNNAARGERLLTTNPDMVSTYTPELAKDIVHFQECKADTPEEFIHNCREKKITYIVWDSIIGSQPKSYEYKIWHYENIAQLAQPQSTGPYEYIIRINLASYGYVNVFRLDGSQKEKGL